MNVVHFEKDLKYGKKGEEDLEFFLKFYGIQYIDVRNQRYGHDYYSPVLGKIEVKRSFDLEKEYFFLEEDHNIDKNIGPLRKGWLHTTDSDHVLFIDKGKQRKVDKIIIIFKTKELKSFYKNNYNKWRLYENKVTYKNNRPRNKSTFKSIPYKDICGNLPFIVWLNCSSKKSSLKSINYE